MVETMSPQAALPFLPPPPLLLLVSGLRRHRRNRRRSVRCQRTSCCCCCCWFQRTLAGARLTAATVGTSAPLGFILPHPTLHITHFSLLVVHSCSQQDLVGQDGLLLPPRHVARLRLRPALPPVDRGAVQCSGSKPGRASACADHKQLHSGLSGSLHQFDSTSVS